MKFKDTKEGKTIFHAIHEHNFAIGSNRRWLGYLRELIKQDKVTTEELTKIIVGIEKGNIKAQEAVDYAYTKLKEKYESTNS